MSVGRRFGLFAGPTAIAGVDLMIDTSATRGYGTYDRVSAADAFWLNALDALTDSMSQGPEALVASLRLSC